MKKLLIIWVWFMAVETRDTKMILLFTRHGARYSNNDIEIPSQKGMLTEVGLRMGYELGRYMKTKFSDFVSSKLDIQRTTAISSGIDRARQYLQAVMMGIFDLGSLNYPVEGIQTFREPEWEGFKSGQAFSTALPQGYQPVPVQSYYSKDNYVFAPFNQDICPAIVSKLSKNASQVEEMNNLVKAILPKIKNEWDYTTLVPVVSDYEDLYHIFDYIVSKKFLGVQLVSENLLNQITILVSMSALTTYDDKELVAFFTSELNKLMIGFLEDVKRGLQNQSSKYQNLVVMGGQELNFLFFYNQLGFTSYKCLLKQYRGSSQEFCPGLPEFNSSFYFEVYSESGENYVDFVLNGVQRQFCKNQTQSKCTLDATIARLKGLVLPLSHNDLMAKHCKLPPNNSNNQLFAMFVFNVVAVAVVYKLTDLVKRRPNS